MHFVIFRAANPLPSEQPLTSQPAPVANAFHFESQPQAAAASFDSQTADPDAIEIVAGSPADQSLAENHSPLGTLSSNTSSTPTLPQLRFYDLSQADRSIAEPHRRIATKDFTNRARVPTGLAIRSTSIRGGRPVGKSRISQCSFALTRHPGSGGPLSTSPSGLRRNQQCHRA